MDKPAKRSRQNLSDIDFTPESEAEPQGKARDKGVELIRRLLKVAAAGGYLADHGICVEDIKEVSRWFESKALAEMSGAREPQVDDIDIREAYPADLVCNHT